MHRTLEIFRRCGSGIGLMALAACSPSALVDVTPPGTVVDPSVATSAAGAAQLYNFAITRFATRFSGQDLSTDAGGVETVTIASGYFTDELMMTRTLATNADIRAGNEGSAFQFFQQARGDALRARQALQLYALATPVAWQGQLLALEAYTVLWFAEIFCSGVPLSTAPLVGSPQLTRGFTTSELFERAAAMFDSAMALGADTARFVLLAKVGKGRALLGLGRFADAVTVVQDVPTDFVYAVEHNTGVVPNYIGRNPRGVQVVDAEGGNGLVWSADPRAAITTTPALSGAMKVSAKYSRTASGTLDATQNIPDNPVRVADGVEARLIEAEADLAANGSSWLATLNTLRNSCVGSAVCAPVVGLTTALLPPLTDPGTPAARLDLLMRERAMWLFLTAHRQGDLRRLGHIYHRDKNTLWPTGIYVNPGFPPFISAHFSNGQPYGDFVVFRVNNDNYNESAVNPLYGGCDNLDP